MASNHACWSAEAYHEQHEAVVNETCNKAHDVVNKHCYDHGAVTAGCIKNLAKGNCVKFLKEHNWCGEIKEDYPPSVARHHSGNFVHSAHCGGHYDEAAVVYSDECGSGWLLAWSVNDNYGGCNNPNKVYVESGPIQNYKNNINWCAIRAKLDASCDTSYYVDDSTGNEAFAKISEGKKAALVATFSNYSC